MSTVLAELAMNVGGASARCAGLARPTLMVEILRDGRVLVDRDERWPQLHAGAERIRERSEEDRRLRSARAREAAVAFKRRAEAGT